ncbi:MAG TPA: S8 family serine peptidase, partial [Burkholderiaceae bacterium]|nr:S8 family serine peptidase [Burkholderiaceae bacterium]
MKLTSIRRGMLACVGAAWLAAAPLHAAAGGPAGKLERTADSSLFKQEFTDRLIVKYREAQRASAADAGLMGAARTVAARRNLGLQQVRRTAQGAEVLQLNRRISLREAYALAQEIQAQDASVQYAEPDRRVHALFTPNDPLFQEQWQYHEPAGINAPGAWNKSTGRGVVVAVIDTGYRPHADLVANIVPGYDFIGVPQEGRDGDGRDANAMDEGDYLTAADCGQGGSADEIRSPSSFHGTHVAGTVAAVTHNGIGVSGTAFNAKVQPLRVLGPCGGLMSDVSDA